MFKELMPIIQDRPLTITVVCVRDGKIKLCVIPHSQEKDEETNKKVGYRKDVAKISDQALKALTTPLAVEGTPEELDRELPIQLTSYAEVHEKLQNGIAEATQRITAALIEIEERDKSKAKAKGVAEKGKESSPQGTKKEVRAAGETSLPLGWCAPAEQAVVSVNDSLASTQGGDPS